MQRKDLWAILLSMFVMMMGYGVTLPVLPFHIERMALSEVSSVKEVPFHVGALTGIYALMQFFFAPLWGKFSDRVGRRPVFAMGLVGFSIFMVFFGLVEKLWLLYGSRILSGAFSAAVLPVANAYVSDITTEKDRGRAMAWLGSSISLGIVAGPVLGAFLSQFDFQISGRFWNLNISGFSIPFFAASLLSIIALGVTMSVLRESIDSGRKMPNKAPVPSKGQTKSSLGTWFIPLNFGSLLVMAFVSQFALAAFEGTFALHAKRTSQFGILEMGWVFVVCGSVMAGAQAIFAGPLMERHGEKRLLSTGFLLMAGGLVMLMTTQAMPFIMAYVALLAFGVALIIPSLATLASKHRGNHSGAAMGQLTAANNLGQAVGPALAGALLAKNIHTPYLLVASILFLTAFYSIIGNSLCKRS
ncbi:MAG: MFS transporter [Deltaproteobacteria bacterium]|nr:MFS transporter [Deltaproteobacteria bacterium]